MTYPLRATALALLLLAGCATSTIDEPVKPATISLVPGADAPLSSSVTLRFDSIADSRCPPNVLCVWAGTVAYHFTLSSRKGKEAMRLEMGDSFDSVHLPGVRIELGSAFPGPVKALGETSSPHPVSLSIVRF
ncbi:MAG: hypothetical protein V4723_13600 [Pseudomonadota bacterium]